MKKNKKLVIAIVIIIVLILIVGVALAFVMKKNNKDAFFESVSQLFDSENGFIDNRIENYNQKKTSNPFENTGKITFNVPTEGMDTKTADEINNTFNISFMGNIDAPNQKAEELVKINYDKDNNFPILYKKSGDIQAIKLSKITPKYLGLDFSKNINIIPFAELNGEKLNSFEITQSEKNKIKTEYLQIIKDNLEDKNFTKITTEESNGYVLEISNKQLQDLIVKLIERLKQDDEFLEKFSLTADSLDSVLDNINLNEGKTIITIYQKNQKVNRIILELDDFMKIDVKKLENDNELSYDISLTFGQENSNIIAKAVIGFTGLDSLETVNENYNIGIDFNGYSYTYNIENEVNFTDDIEIKDFADKEYVDINTLSQTNQVKLLQAIADRFNKINNELIQKVKADPEDFWYNLVPKYYAPKIDADEFDYSLDLDNDEDDDENTISNTTNTTENTTNTTSNTINTTNTATSSNTTNTTTNINETSDENLAKSFTETEKNVFNSKYEKYKGDEVEGSKVKQLIMNIIANNMADEERQIKVTGDVTLTGNEVPDSIETTKKYSVEFKKSKEGYVNEAVIKEVE